MSERFLYFDLGKVLLHFSHEQAARQMAAVANCSYALVWDVVFGTQRLEFAYEAGEMTSEQFYAYFCQRTNSQPPYMELMVASAAIFSPMPGTFELAQELHEQGKRLGILSNTSEAHWRYCTAHYPQLSKLFSLHCLSFRVGTLKPDARIYHTAAEMANTPCEQIFFVDDREENVAGAQAVGMDAVLFHSAEQLREDLHARGIL